MIRRSLLAAPALLAVRPALGQREVADATGRRVALPDRVTRIFPAGAPAAVLTWTLAPDLLLGWPAPPPSPSAAALLDPRAAALPTLAAPNGTPKPGAIAAARPDLVLDYGAIPPQAAQRVARITAETGIPALLLDGALAKLPETYLHLGAILDRLPAAEERAQAAAAILAEARHGAARLAQRDRPRVFLAHGPHGAATVPRGALAAEALDLAGAETMAQGSADGQEIAAVTVEQVQAWDPDWIIAAAPDFLRHARTDQAWHTLRAVRQARIVLAPQLPFGWLDSPPAANRLLGLMWLAALFGLVPADALPVRVAAFHALFYHRRPTPAQVTRLLASAFPQP